jgi:hypothetical protein
MQQSDFLFARPDRVKEHRFDGAGRADLYVLTSVFNAVRYRVKWKLYEDYLKRVKESGAQSWVVEAAFHDREFVLKDLSVQPDHLLQLVVYDELWLKENLLNRLAADLPHTWKYLYLCDADMRHGRDDWANQIVQTLQHYAVIQGWRTMIDLNHEYQPVGQCNSFFANWRAGLITTANGEYYAPGKPGYPGAPGLGQGWRRDAWDAVGGLIDWPIVGACDSYMAWALIGQLGRALRRDFHKGYTDPMYEWQRKAVLYIKKNIGAMDDVALHYFHGPKAKRGYNTRERILSRNKFNPAIHLKRDFQGLYQLEKSAPNYEELRDDLRTYFRSRQEDLYG